MIEASGSVLIFSGPHGAGKDTLEGQFRQLRPQTERIARHITRPAAPNELDGRDYHFIDDSQFSDMVKEDVFIEHSAYPDCMAGTSRNEVVDKLRWAEFASMTANFEEGLSLQRALGTVGLTSTCFFISPVSREIMQEEPEVYIAALRDRMEGRGRPDDRIANKLIKAAFYRTLYLQNESQIVYIDNSKGNARHAVRNIDEVARGKR